MTEWWGQSLGPEAIQAEETELSDKVLVQRSKAWSQERAGASPALLCPGHQPVCTASSFPECADVTRLLSEEGRWDGLVLVVGEMEALAHGHRKDKGVAREVGKDRGLRGHISQKETQGEGSCL